jgi:hypothetical protein
MDSCFSDHRGSRVCGFCAGSRADSRRTPLLVRLEISWLRWRFLVLVGSIRTCPLFRNQHVAGSNPAGRSNKIKYLQLLAIALDRSAAVFFMELACRRNSLLALTQPLANRVAQLFIVGPRTMPFHARVVGLLLRAGINRDRH